MVQDAKYEDLRLEIPRQVFVSHLQTEWASEMTAYVRTSLPSDQMFATLRRELRQMDAAMPIFDMSTMEDQLDRSLALERLVASLSTAFSLVATALAMIGLYGVTAYSVARRAPEFGLRMALGARAGNVVRMVLREVLLLAAVGLAVALPAAWWLTQLVRSQLYGVEPRDPLTLAASTLGLLAVAALAGAEPALKASRLDPARVLRYE